MQYKTINEIAFINPDSIKKGYPHKEIEYVDISSVGTGALLGVNLIPLSEASSRAKRLVKNRDTILSTVRPNRRSFLYIKRPKDNTVVSTGFAVLRAKDGIDPRYLYYAVTDQRFTNYLTSSAKGAAYPAVDTEIIQRGKVPYWPQEIQNKISSVLSAYDDFIENNTRRIHILEEMAQRIYREWFVDFHFPGYKKMSFIDSEMGKIPNGWECKNLFDLADVTYGYPFQSKLFEEDPSGMPVIRIRDILNCTTNTFTKEKPKKECLLENGDILVGMDGDFHMCLWAGGKAYLNQRVTRLKPKNGLSKYYLFLAIRKHIEYFNDTIVGTTVSHLGDNHLRTIKLMSPNQKINEETCAILDPMCDLTISLLIKNKVLKAKREILLPKLVSGEMDLSELDIIIREQANVA